VLLRMALWSVFVIAKKAPIFQLNAGGAKLRLPANLSHTSVAAFVLRDHIEPELGYLELLLPPRGTFIDVGANVGLFTLKAAQIVGATGTVVAFEPGNAAFARLSEHVALNAYRQVHLMQDAVSDHEGTAVLHHVDLGHDPQAYSLLDDGSNMPGETVRLTTLDAMLHRLELSRVDVIKMDVEGVEPEVLAGATELLRRFHPIVIFEINHPISVTQGLHLRAYNHLRDAGYAMWRMHRGQLLPVTTLPEGVGNLVAIHPDGVQPVLKLPHR
jgi:FkbM family methyltransferase